MYRKFGKRLVDILLAGLALLLLSPLMLSVALAIKLTDPGPVRFVQERVGRAGKHFRFHKFRSMPVDTDNVSSERLGSVKLSLIGRIIRRTNIDELPQLYNILIGDMSIVGPRPPLPSQAELVDMRRDNGALACRPGLTGLAQVKAYDGMTVAEKARFDADYAQNISLATDLEIIVRTFAYLLKKPPVY